MISLLHKIAHINQYNNRRSSIQNFIKLPGEQKLRVPFKAVSLDEGPRQTSPSTQDVALTNVPFFSHIIPFLSVPLFRDSQKHRVSTEKNET